MARIINYIKDTRAEMKHVSWPTRKQALAYSFLVIVFSLFVAFLLGIFDHLFTKGLDSILGL